MTETRCAREAEVLAAVRAGSLSAALQRHASTCPDCSAALMADTLVHFAARHLPPMKDLPDPVVVWWRARQHDRLRKAERATLPIQLAERLALAVGALGLVIGLSLIWPLIRSTASSWLGTWAMGFSHSIPLAGSSLILALVCSILFLVGYGLYSQWAEG